MLCYFLSFVISCVHHIFNSYWTTDKFSQHICHRPCHPAFDSKNDSHKTLLGRNHGVLFCALYTEIIFTISAAFCVSDFVLHICSNTFFCHNVSILLPLAGVTNLRLLVGVCAARMLAYVQISRWNGVQSWRLSPLRRRRHCWCANTFPPASFQCSHRFVVAHFCIICSLHLIAIWFLPAIWLAAWSLQLPLFLAFYVSRGRAGGSYTSLRTLCFHFAVA